MNLKNLIVIENRQIQPTKRLVLIVNNSSKELSSNTSWIANFVVRNLSVSTIDGYFPQLMNTPLYGCLFLHVCVFFMWLAQWISWLSYLCTVDLKLIFDTLFGNTWWRITNISRSPSVDGHVLFAKILIQDYQRYPVLSDLFFVILFKLRSQHCEMILRLIHPKVLVNSQTAFFSCSVCCVRITFT